MGCSMENRSTAARGELHAPGHKLLVAAMTGKQIVGPLILVFRQLPHRGYRPSQRLERKQKPELPT